MDHRTHLHLVVRVRRIREKDFTQSRTLPGDHHSDGTWVHLPGPWDLLMGKKKLKGIIRGGHGFFLKTSPRRVTVVNMSTYGESTYKVPTDVVNTYDLRIWANGYLAREV